jgi:serine/threonine protein kinase
MMNAAEEFRPASSATLDDPRVVAALREYLAALENGERPDRAAFLARHSDIAGALSECLDGLDFVHSAGRSGPAQSSHALDGLVQAGTPLGDFRIIREVGRGGMGVVYEAEQLSLGRRVALKVLPFAATMDPRHLQRFQNEARAAACLQHPHIVPVHAVGCERGVHYYAMQFIDGQSLGQVIEVLRASKELNHRDTENTEKRQQTAVSSLCPLWLCGSNDFFRRIAEWGIQAAEALEHAHSVGIVHRDIKPANLMIDSHGSLWITDFGLARTAADAGLTMTGDVLGTLRYMSPEQALAKHGLVDHRTDIYSLGVTLYELLTGTPAVTGKVREAILNAITLDEPRPLRALEAAIPQDVETIVLKAIEKDPHDRYATARELADDLRRFLEDKPLRTRRPTLWQRAARWARRHKAVVRAFSLGLALAVIALAVSTVLVWRAYRAEAEQRQLADARLREAKEQRRQARQAVDTMYLEVAQNWLDRQPQMGELQKQFLEKVVRYYQAFAEEEGGDEETRFDKAMAFMRVGQLFIYSLARHDQAEAPLREAIPLLEDLADQFPAKGVYTLKLAEALNLLAFSTSENRRQNLERAVSLLDGLVERFPSEPEYRYGLAYRLTNLGMDCTLSGELDEAERRCRRAVRLAQDLIRSPSPRPEHHRILGGAAEDLADSQRQSGKWVEAAENYRKAVAAYERLTTNASGLPEYQHDLQPFYWHNLGNIYRNLGTTLGHLRRIEEAEAAFARAVRIHTKLVEDFPNTSHYWHALFRDYRDEGTMLWSRGQSRAADRAYDQTLEFGNRMIEAFPLDDLHDLAEFLVICPDPKRRDAKRARDLASKMTQRSPELDYAWTKLGMASYRLGDYASAIAALEKAISLKRDKYPTEQFFLAMAHWQLRDKQQAREWFEMATAWMSKNACQEENLLRFRAEASALLGISDAPSPSAQKKGGNTAGN